MHQPEILNPQTREIYEALLVQGHFEEAVKLAQEANMLDVDPMDVSENYDYIAQKERTVKNIFIHILSKSLEKHTCTKDINPCNICLEWSRKVVPDIWKPISDFIRDLENRGGWLTLYQMFDKLQKRMESSEPLPVVESHPKITKAPNPGATS